MKRAALGLPMALLLASPAAGDPEEDSPRTKRASEILANMDSVGAAEPLSATPPTKPVEILAHMDSDLVVKPNPFTRLGLNTRHGLSYRQSLQFAGRRLELRVNGPVQRRKSFGLGFKIKF